MRGAGVADMMRVWMVMALAATLLPLVGLAVWTWPTVAATKRSRAARGALAVAFLSGALFVLLRPHDDVFAGLDIAPYRTLASVFWNGRGFQDPDTVLRQVPESLRPVFLYSPGGRPTRDLSFQLTSLADVGSKPFFLPTLPLAAGALSPLASPDVFVPLLAVVWWWLVLSGAYRAGGGWGVAAAGALALGSAWPAWFLRGFFAEAAGTLLVASVVAAASVRRPRGAMVAVVGFALGLAVAYHPTLLVVAGPVGLGLALESERRRHSVGLAVGGALGVFPLWAITRWVCQPYGDWTRLRPLWRMVTAVPELRAVAFVAMALFVVALVGLGALGRPAGRAWLRRIEERMSPWVWAGMLAAPFVLIAVLPGSVGLALRRGAMATWSGIRWPYGLLLAVAITTALRRGRPALERFWILGLVWGALFFLFVKGVEVPVGLWSHRRLLPVMVTAVPLLAAPLAVLLARLASVGRGPAVAVAVGLAIAAFANLARWPAAYGAVNERGATAWAGAASGPLADDGWTLFDYYPHAVPHMASLRHRVLGLGEKTRDRWPEVAGWLRGVADETEVRVVTSWTPCTLEEGARLVPIETLEGQFPVVRAKAFFPAESALRTVRNTFCRWVPLVDGETADQDKTLDGSPLGLRGPWGPSRPVRTSDGQDRPAVWTREGSGIVGPVPPSGGRVVVRLDGASGRKVPQHIRVHAPWALAPLELDIGPSLTEASGVLVRPVDGAGGVGASPTCVYTLSCPEPYDPSVEGLRGYPSDLGIQLCRVTLRVAEGPVASGP